ncbi:sulfotransferase family protein [Aurantiacibacter zhengii]|uniref:Sulfotransferase n=1 Tax=Aurantiacibacter zhengii TaxID=2307003 RepID=A0A418NRF4_9SPHN|nr:sulfotransferase [Aurantiacibacter zhengii]RIV85628.1 sulfotransferase [Aurantiacibacter zhengii]
MTPGERHYRYLFVCGLHRTGTSLIARLLAAHDAIDAIVDAPVPENEGVYLQGAIPHTARHGVPGHYAVDPEQHLIEGCAHDTLPTRKRMEHDWAPWFTTKGQWRLEKSPVNLTRMRLYQQLFPLSQFIVILRHPEAVAAALRKWVDRPAEELIDYTLDAYDLAFADLEYIHAATVVRYEDLVAQPQAVLDRITQFAGLAPVKVQEEVRDGNETYDGASCLDQQQAVRASRYGYLPGMRIDPGFGVVKHPLRAVREAALEGV